MTDARRWTVLLAACWLGMLLTVAGIATPAPFSTLPPAEAGRVAARVLAAEAAASLAFGAVLLGLQRIATRRRLAAGERVPQLDAVLVLAAAAVFCTLAGYYAIVPMMAEARAGRGALGFGQLHAISTAFFVVKALCVAALAWRVSRPCVSSG